MEPKPKERIVFDEDSYYGDEGAEWAVNDLMERKGLTEDEVRTCQISSTLTAATTFLLLAA